MNVQVLHDDLSVGAVPLEIGVGVLDGWLLLVLAGPDNRSVGGVRQTLDFVILQLTIHTHILKVDSTPPLFFVTWFQLKDSQLKLRSKIG